MSDKKRTTAEFTNFEDWSLDTYQTGSTQPPKSRGGLVAFLLGLVIFLCGITTALSMMNFKLQWQLNQQPTADTSSLAFAKATGPDLARFSESTDFPLGFSGQAVSQFWNLYEDLPQGIYITEVYPTGDAAAKGICPGDILLSVNGFAVSTGDELAQLLRQYPGGQTVKAIIHRNGQQLPFLLRVDERGIYEPDLP